MAKYEAEYEYTDAELLALFRQAKARVSISGESYTIGGRTFRSADLAEINRTIKSLEAAIGAASGPAVNYAKRGRH